MKERRKPEYPEKTPDDELKKCHMLKPEPRLGLYSPAKEVFFFRGVGGGRGCGVGGGGGAGG